VYQGRTHTVIYLPEEVHQVDLLFNIDSQPSTQWVPPTTCIPVPSLDLQHAHP
jgi:hypothetical protein